MQETIIVTNAAELEAAVNAADGGEIIELADGAYGELTLTGTYSDTLTIRSANTGGATFESIIFNGAKQITVEDVHVEADTNGSITQPLVRVEGGSEAITVTGSELNGPVDDVYSGIYGVHILDSDNIIIEDNNIHDVRNGIVVQSSDGTQIIGNNLDYLGNDAMKFSGVTNVLIEDNVGGGNVFPGEGAHLDFIQFQSADSTGITIRGNVYLGSSRANVQGIFLDDAEFNDVLIENNIIYTDQIRGINVTAGDNISVLNNTVLNIPGGGKATKIFLPDGAVKEGNIESSFRGEIIGTNLTVQNADPSDPFYVNDLFVNGTAGLGITLEDLQTITGSLAEEYGAVGRVAELLRQDGPSEETPQEPVEEPETDMDDAGGLLSLVDSDSSPLETATYDPATGDLHLVFSYDKLTASTGAYANARHIDAFTFNGNVYEIEIHSADGPRDANGNYIYDETTMTNEFIVDIGTGHGADGESLNFSFTDYADGTRPLYSFAIEAEEDATPVDPMTSAIYGTVFIDNDANGAVNYEEDDAALGATIRLLDASGNLLETTQVVSGGGYQFLNLAAGDYIVEFPTEFNGRPLITPGQGNDADADSDADIATGRSDVISLDVGEFGRVFAGFEPPEPVIIEAPETPTVPVSADVAVFLIDADTDTPIYEIVAGEEFSFDMSSYDNVNLMVATEVAGVESVKLSLDGGSARTESAAPFAVFGDDGQGDFFDGVDLAEGLHTISISAYSADGAKGDLLFETDFSFTATDSNAAEAPVVVEEPETPVEEPEAPNEPPVVEEPETPVEEPVAEETPSENDVITVSSSAELSEALLNATGGEIIEVVNTGVNYEFGLYKNFTPDSMVTVRAEDPDNPATFHTVYMREGQNLTLDGLQFGSTPDEVADRSGYLTDIYMHDVTNVTITNSRLIGTADGYAETEADLVEDILRIRGGENIEVSNNFISNSRYGMTLTDTVGITITDNEITKVQGDGIRLGGVQDVVIDGNFIHDFLSSSNQLIHDDMIQIWSKDTYTQTQNVQITNNILDQGEGEYSQGIFIGNEKTRTPDGVFDDDVLHVDLLIENNFINTSHLHAIALEGVDGAVVANNTIVENPEYVADLKARTEAAGEPFNSSIFTPSIRANRNVENIELIDNQVPRLIVEGENIVESGNGPNGIGADLENPVSVDGEPEAPVEPPVVVEEPETPVEPPVVVEEPETPVEEPETPVEPEVPETQDFTVFLVDAETDEVLTQVTNGEELSFEFGQHNNVNLAVYSADAEVESIVLQLNGENRRVENVEPYALFGDSQGDFADGIELGSGEFTLSVSGYSVDRARGEQLFDEDFTFSIG